MDIGFAGLGKMGRPMAANLAAAGHALRLYNRTPATAEELAEELGGDVRVADTPSEAAAGVQLFLTMLADDRAVEDVVLGDEGALAGLPEGGIHASMSTISPALTRRLAAVHAEAGQGFVAAPVFGRPQAARAAELWIVAAGRRELVDACRPAFDAVGQGVLVLDGDVSAAPVVKAAGNFLLSSAIEAMAEACAMVRKHDIEPARFLEIANGHVIRSPVYEGYGGLIAEGRYEPAGFELRHGLKDTELVLEAAREVDAPMPLASLIRDHYLSGVARGWGEIDWAALGRLADEAAGLP